MNKSYPIVSIIIVNYKVEKELFACLESIENAKTRISYEVIVVDNDTKSKTEKTLYKIFPKVRYVKNEANVGFGAANNIGARKAQADYLFFLNPDTLIHDYTLDRLVGGFSCKNNVAAVGPKLLSLTGETIPQGTTRLGIIEGIFCLSFINRLSPNNIIARKYFMHEIDKSMPYEADTIAGTALVVKKNAFFRIKGFDENFFLYFEEFDLCRRLHETGFSIVVIPQAIVSHMWEVSTKKRSDIKQIFAKSRFYYFKKYYGLLLALLIEVFADVGKVHFLLFGILLLSSFLHLYHLSSLMTFIGDQGWFYLSARDMLLTGSIPLAGIASSHPWLHQGPLWTYMLGVALWLSNFNPLSGAYLTAFLGIFTAYIMYKINTFMFSRRVGLIAAMLYGTSPLVVMNNRFAYHTSPIPFFVILFIFCLFQWINGRAIFFPLTIAMLAILYNLEIATSPLIFLFIVVLGYAFLKKPKWWQIIQERKIIALSLLGFLIPMLPMILYDVGHGFPQTLGFLAWVGYRLTKFLPHGFDLYGAGLYQSSSPWQFLHENVTRLLFLANGKVAIAILGASLLASIKYLYEMYKQKKWNLGYILLIFALLFSFGGFLAVQSSSDAYLPIFFPILISLIAYIFSNLLFRKGVLFLGVTIVVILLVNIYSLMNNDYKYKKDDTQLTLVDRINAAKTIVMLSGDKQYNLIGVGQLSQFRSYTMNYEYLAWWLGKPPSSQEQITRITIDEKNGAVIVKKQIVK